MARAVLLLVLLFAVLFLLRTLRILLRQWLGRGPARRPPPVEGEMMRDPVCGAWFDRRLAVPVRRGGAVVEVCSEGCRRRLEAG